MSGNLPLTTLIPSSEIHTQSPSTALSLSTVTMSTNSSVLVFEEAVKTTDVSAVPTSNVSVTSVASMSPDEYSCRKPLSYVSAYTLSVLWHVVYWTSQALTWFAVFCYLLFITVSM